MQNPFRYFKTSPEVIRLAVVMYIRYPLSLRQVEDLLFERGIDICHGGNSNVAFGSLLPLVGAPPTRLIMPCR